MSNVDKLLKYQETDEKLLRLEREASNSEERKNFVQAKNFLTKAPEKLDALDAKARELETLLSELNAKYAEIDEELSDFEHLDELVSEGADISFYKKSVSQLTEKIKSVRAEVASLTKAVKEADDEYQSMKKKTIAVQKQYAEYSEVYKKYKESKLKEMEEVKKELAVLSKGLGEEVIKKYEIKRSERIFPILCAVKDGRCSKCGNELSLAGKERINGGNVCECENCHRILYNPQ